MTQPLSLRNLNRDEYLTDPLRKQTYVNTVFAIVASSYDRFTRLCSFGMDMTWKRQLVRLVKPHLRANDVIADLATGTGDLAFLLAPSVQHGKVIGIDIADDMIHRAEEIRRSRCIENVEFRIGDLMDVKLPDNSVDVVTVSYGLRNCPDYRQGLREIGRILKLGGHLATLDFVRPGNAVWESVFVNALLVACNFYGWLWHAEPAAYGYLAHSIRHFVTNPEFVTALGDSGFELITQRAKLGGAVYIHVARKKSAE